MTKVAAIIVAAGSGVRMGASVPKQFIEIAGKPILQHTLERFEACTWVTDVCVILPAAFVDLYRVKILEWGISKLAAVTVGGAERHQSVLAGLEALSDDTEIVMIHDGVRPFVSDRILRESIDAARQFGAVVVGLPPKDTIKQADYPMITQTLDRNHLIQAQTPQTFRTEVIRRAYQFAGESGHYSTDDAALVEQMGGEVVVVNGDWKNIKITSPEDLIIAEAFLEQENADRPWS
jgi:2-C-methyl-D-erythritol 4-phosphate cytidylyltransferase